MRMRTRRTKWKRATKGNNARNARHGERGLISHCRSMTIIPTIEKTNDYELVCRHVDLSTTSMKSEEILEKCTSRWTISAQ